MKKAVSYFGLISLILCCSLLLCAQESRTWKDDTGLFSIEATFEKLDGNSVQLKKADGVIVTLPLARLSEADQQHVAKLTAVNPFEVTQAKGDAVAAPNSINMSADIKAVDLSKTRDAGDVVPDVWNYAPDPAPQREYPSEVVRLNFRIPNTSINSPQDRLGFFVDSAGKTAVHTFSIDDPGNSAAQRAAAEERNAAQRAELQARIAEQQAATAARIAERRGTNPQPANPQPAAAPVNVAPANAPPDLKGKTWIFIGDTVSGNVVTLDSPLKLVPLGFSPDGKRLLFRQEDWTAFSIGKKTLLHVVKVPAIEESAEWNTIATFEPFAQSKRSGLNASSNADITFATWVDDEHALVRSGGGILILLNIDSGEAIWRRQIESRDAITLSPGGKYCFLPMDNRAVLCETMTGKSVGAVNGGGAISQAFRFSPDGKRLVALNNTQGIILGDATTGTVEAPFFVERRAPQELSLFWLDNQYLFYGGEIIDTASKRVIWTYTGIGDNVKLVGGYVWCYFSRTSRDGKFLAPITIPHAKVLEKDFSGDAESGLVLKPGAEVALVLDDSIEKNRSEIRAGIEKIIAANDWKIVDGASVSIVLKTEKQEEDKVSYTAGRWSPLPIPRVPMPSRIFGGGEGSNIPIVFQPERFSLTIKQDNRTIWSKDHKTTPPDQFPLNVVQNDSLQGVVDKAMEEQSFLKWLEGVKIPQTISRPRDGKGQSQVTENGISEVVVRR